MKITPENSVNMDMLNQANRFKTFTNWVYKDNSGAVCTALKMAEAGFYFIGNKNEPDLVKCFVCMKQLDGWDSDDDPFQEHEKHASYCPFVQLGKKEADLRIVDMVNLTKSMLEKHIQEEYVIAEKAMQKDADALRKSVITLYKKRKTTCL